MQDTRDFDTARQERTLIDDVMNAQWFQFIEPRYKKEILFALVYTRDFNHGTSGHIAYSVITELVKVLQTR